MRWLRHLFDLAGAKRRFPPTTLDAIQQAIAASEHRHEGEIVFAVEGSLGRVRRERWGPRVIDLDILWCRGVTVSTEELVVPHPELRVRPFALVPLLDVAPDASDPGDLADYAAVLERLDASGVREVPASRGTWCS